MTTATEFGVVQVDESWAAARTSGSLHLDLTQCTYLSHSALLYIVAMARRRHLTGLQTRLALPRSWRVIDYLRAWRFPDAMELVCDAPFADLVDNDSRSRLAGMAPVSRYESVIVTPEGGRESLLPVSFFAITPIRISSPVTPELFRTSPERAATAERDKWLNIHIRSVLDRYLNDFGDTVGTRIVYEAVLNAASHPGAELGFASAQILKHRTGQSKGLPSALEVAIWDDGRTFVQTLGGQIERQLPITSEAYGKRDERFRVALSGPRGVLEPLELDSRKKEIPTSPPALMISAFMLGVTSRPDRPPTIDEYGKLSEDPGLGLYYVRRAAIDKFGGAIDYFAGQFHATIRASRERWHYEASVDYSPETRADIAGNLLIVRIPLDSKGDVRMAVET